MRIHWIIAAAGALVFAMPGAQAEGTTKIYLIRHAETVGNSTGNYTPVTEAQFSPRGWEQVAAVPKILAPYTYDYIAVSPTWRTRQTILPYLKEQQRKGTFWPEIEEGGCGLGGRVTPAATLPKGNPITLTEEERQWFRLRSDGADHRFAPTNDADSTAIYLEGVRLLKERFDGAGKSVLLVSHSCTGGRYLELLLGLEPRGRFSPVNTGLSMVEEQSPGRYDLMLYNSKPFQQQYRWVLQERVGASCVATGPLELALEAEFFWPASPREYRVVWELISADKTRRATGTSTVLLTANAERQLLKEVMNESFFRAGGEMTLLTTLYKGDDVVQEWQQTLVVPDAFSLAGAWKVQAGDDESWSAVDVDDAEWRTTHVPGNWERDALPEYDGTAWYRFSFTVPEDCGVWADESLALVLGAVDDADVTYLDGVEIGATGEFPPEKVSAWNKKRVYPIPALEPGSAHVIAVRVADWGGNGGITKAPVWIGTERSLREAVDAPQK